MLTYLRAEVPFPLLPYLKSDFAEIPIMIALFILGPIPALTTAIIHFIALTAARGWVLGPILKLLAVAPMIIGFWIGIKILKKIHSKKTLNVGTIAGSGSLGGIIARIIVTSTTNIIVFLVIAPEYLSYAGYTLGL